MEVLSVRDYRNNLAAYFARADKGERVLIRRKNSVYALVNVGKGDLAITPQLQQRIEEAEKSCREGRCVTCRTGEEIEAYIDSM